uniref:Uncharacterized protein n=1 Tax=Plectus sambesii TaxID=2011161 RepID=A0A914V4M4_9BILA
MRRWAEARGVEHCGVAARRPAQSIRRSTVRKSRPGRKVFVRADAADDHRRTQRADPFRRRTPGSVSPSPSTSETRLNFVSIAARATQPQSTAVKVIRVQSDRVRTVLV